MRENSEQVGPEDYEISLTSLAEMISELRDQLEDIRYQNEEVLEKLDNLSKPGGSYGYDEE